MTAHACKKPVLTALAFKVNKYYFSFSSLGTVAANTRPNTEPSHSSSLLIVSWEEFWSRNTNVQKSKQHKPSFLDPPDTSIVSV